MFSRKAHSWTRRWCMGALACAALAAACHSDHDAVQAVSDPAPADPSLELGHLRLPLVTQASGTYRLRAAVFTVQSRSGLSSVTLRSDDAPDAASLDADLLQGSYESTLADGWVLERLDAQGLPEPVRAALITPNPAEFEIQNDQVKELVYSFATDAGVISFGHGSVSVNVAVVPAGALAACNLLDSSGCPSGQSCLLADDSGATFCASSGNLAVGSPCSSEQCVAGAQCLRLPSVSTSPDAGAPAAEGVCSKFCDPQSSFCGCQSLSFSSDIGVCTDPTRGAQFSHPFQVGLAAPDACTDWQSFKASLVGASSARVTVSNDLGTSFTCNDPVAANQICGALANNFSFGSVSCDGHSWFVQNCGNGADVFVDNSGCGCSFSGGSVRPCDGTQWGGLGNTCSFGMTSQTLLVTCDNPRGTCGDGLINQPSEQCDGTTLPPSATPGSRCTADCQLVNTCGNGVIDPGEPCDGTAFPPGTPAGTRCSSSCTLGQPGTPSPDCRACNEGSCADQTAAVIARGALAASVMECVLGPDWRDSNRAAASSCANGDLLQCFCGTRAGQDCANAAVSSLNGQCTSTILAATGCTAASCVAPILLNPSNAAGVAMQQIQCRQDFCFDSCFDF